MSDKRYWVNVNKISIMIYVMDTNKPYMRDGKQIKGRDGRYHFEPVCECYNTEDAELICKALNAMNDQLTLGGAT